jgi:hypothetical protein
MTAALTVGAFSTAQAQQQQQQQRSPQPQTQQRSSQPQTQQQAVSDKEIQDFAAAASDVRQLNRQWVPKVQAAAQQGPDAEQKARQQAMSEMTQAVQKRGLSVEQYNKMVELAQANPEVQRKIQERMQNQKQ